MNIQKVRTQIKQFSLIQPEQNKYEEWLPSYGRIERTCVQALNQFIFKTILLLFSMSIRCRSWTRVVGGWSRRWIYRGWGWIWLVWCRCGISISRPCWISPSVWLVSMPVLRGMVVGSVWVGRTGDVSIGVGAGGQVAAAGDWQLEAVNVKTLFICVGQQPEY